MHGTGGGRGWERVGSCLSPEHSLPGPSIQQSLNSLNLICLRDFITQRLRTLTVFSVSVHRHQWRKWIGEDRKHPPHRSASDFPGKGKGQLNSAWWFEGPAEPTVRFIADGSIIVFFF